MSPSAEEPPDPPDRDLVARAKGGDRDAFGDLAERYYRMVSILALQKIRNRADAEDVVQEAFVRAYRALDSLREAEKFGGWLYHITVKLCLDHLRRTQRHEPTLSLDEEGHAGDGSTAPALEAMEAEEEQRKVSSAVAALPEKYRLVVTLRFLEKKSYKEIALLLGEPDGTIANRIHRAVKMLQAGAGELLPSSDTEEEADA